MNDLQKLTGGRRPFFINAADGPIDNKRFYLIVPLENTTFTALESNTGTISATMIDEKEAMNINSKTLTAGIPINCDGEAYFTLVHVATGSVAAYEAF